LDTDEIEWQISMADKYGPNIANWNKEEIAARRAEAEKKTA